MKTVYEREKCFKPNYKSNKGKRLKGNIDGLNRKGPRNFVKFKFKTNLTLNSGVAKLNQKHDKINNVQHESETLTRQAEIVTGVGLSVPICSGEEVVCILKKINIQKSN